MSPIAFQLDFDNLFQTASTEKFSAEKPEAVDEEFAVLLASLVSVYQPESVKVEQKVENLTQVENTLPDKAERKVEAAGEFIYGNPSTARVFNFVDKNDEIFSRLENLEKDFGSQSYKLQPSQLFQSDSDVPQVKYIKGLITEIESAQIKLPEASGFIESSFELNSPQPEKEQSQLPNKADSDLPPKQQGEILEDASSDNKLPFPIWIKDGKFETKNPKDSKKISLEKEQKIEKTYKGEKRFEFEKERVSIPIIPPDDIAELTQTKTPTNFQTVLENFSESREGFTFSPKNVKAEEALDYLQEYVSQTEISTETVSAKKVTMTPFVKNIEKVSERLVEQTIVLTQKMENPNELQSIEAKLNAEKLEAVKTNNESSLARQTYTKLETEAKLENFRDLNEHPAPSLKKIKIKEIATGFDEADSQREIITEKPFVKEAATSFSEHFAEKVSEQVVEPMIVLAKETGKANEPRTVKIKLNPEELGTVEITLEGTSSGKLHAELKAETKSAEAALNQNITELQKALENCGWQIETLTVSRQTQSYSNSGQSERQSPQAEAQYKNTSYISESETQAAENDNRLLSVRA